MMAFDKLWLFSVVKRAYEVLDSIIEMCAIDFSFVREKKLNS